MLTQAYLKTILHYDPETGIFTWVKTGKRAGCLSGRKVAHPYRRIRIGRRGYYEQRLAMLYMLGEFPPVVVDHENKDTLCNVFENLRPATYSQNLWERQIPPTSTGVVGVRERNGKFVVEMKMGPGVKRITKTFRVLEDAIAYRHELERIHRVW